MSDTEFDFAMPQLESASHEMAEYIMPSTEELEGEISAALERYQAAAEKAAAGVWKSGVEEALKRMHVRLLIDEPGVIEVTSVPDELAILKEKFNLFSDDTVEEAETAEDVERWIEQMADKARAYFAVKGTAKWEELRRQRYL